MAKISTDSISELTALLHEARQLCLASIDASLSGQYQKAQHLLDDGMRQFVQAHRIHAAMLASEDQDVDLDVVHAEDLLMSAELFTVMTARFIKAAEKGKVSM